MLSQVTNFLKKNKKIMYYLGFFALVYFAMGDSVFAENEWKWGSVDPKTVNWLNSITHLISTWVSIVWWLVWVFLNPSWTNGVGLWIHNELKDLWIMVSNLVYFIFAILIVIIAFMNIIGKDWIWELKQALPKFVIWILNEPST